MTTATETKIRERLGAAIYGTGDATLEAVIAGLLHQVNATLAVAETLTRGDITRRLGAHPDVFRGGVVATDGQRLAGLLHLEQTGVTGEAGVVTLAQGVQRAWGSSYGLAVLTDEPAGPWVAIAGDGAVSTRRLRFSGRDRRARTWTTTLALEFLRRLLLGLADGWAQ